MKFNKYEADQVNNTKKQVEIKVDTGFSWVDISDKEDPENKVFLQGAEAENFIDEAKKLSEKYDEENINDCYAFLAYDYLDVIFHG